MTQNMKTWCCIDKGKSSIKTYFEKNVYTLGEVANMCSEIDNSNCLLNINNISAELVNKIRLQA